MSSSAKVAFQQGASVQQQLSFCWQRRSSTLFWRFNKLKSTITLFEHASWWKTYISSILSFSRIIMVFLANWKKLNLLPMSLVLVLLYTKQWLVPLPPQYPQDIWFFTLLLCMMDSKMGVVLLINQTYLFTSLLMQTNLQIVAIYHRVFLASWPLMMRETETG